MTTTSSPNLAEFYRFFETYGTERLNGLNQSHFQNLTDREKKEAWDFLMQGNQLSEERITGLYLLDRDRAVKLFKNVLSTPIESSPYANTRQAIERDRLALLSYVNSVEPNRQYVASICEFAQSEFPKIRATFAHSLPSHQVTQESLTALKQMIFTETERIPLSAAITKLMLIYGLDYEIDDPTYKSIYASLRSENPQEKMSAMERLEAIHQPDYL